MHRVKRNRRDENVIFKELEELCKSNGYFNVIAFFCLRDNSIFFSEFIESKNLTHLYSNERLVRNEISVLIGLSNKAGIRVNEFDSNTFELLVNKTEELLEEIHFSFLPALEPNKGNKIRELADSPFMNPSLIRESIFYSAESAFNFQYRDFSKIKYQNDDQWLRTNKGFGIDDATRIVDTILEIHGERLNEFINKRRDTPFNSLNFIDIYKFKISDIIAKTGMNNVVIENFLTSFLNTHSLSDFNSIDDFNPTRAYPIQKIDDENYLLFQWYNLVEALYETPFFWFINDKGYKDEALKHRGKFVEEISYDLLAKVFGVNNLYKNVEIQSKNKTRLGEIDVLVVYANRAIVLQAKSKKLTLEARKGNHTILKNDFKKAVEDAYDQALKCCDYLLDSRNIFVDGNGKKIELRSTLNELYPFCIISDHYPGLTFQSFQFLTLKTRGKTQNPIVSDIFFLDVLTEFLNTPLYFLSYLNRRVSYTDKLMTTNELSVLGYHLKHNLWVNNEYTRILIDEDYSIDIDASLLVRRKNVPGNKVPEGILTKFRNTLFEKMIKEIEFMEQSAIVDLGFKLLSLSEETIEIVNNSLIELRRRARIDKAHHDFSLGFDESQFGLTIHCNNDTDQLAHERLNAHCEMRKYQEKAKEWYGVCIGISDPMLRFGVNKVFDWVYDSTLEKLAKENLKNRSPVDYHNKNAIKDLFKNKSIPGRNELCHCGSGIKYKYCHGRS